MISVKVSKSGFTICGHANYAERGRDIVCASVSTLGLVFAKAISKIPDTIITQHEGYLSVEVTFPHVEEEKLNILLNTFKEGIGLIINDYPEYVEWSKGVETNG